MRIDIDKLAANVNDTAAMLREDPTAGHVRPTVRTTLVGNVHSESHFVQYDKDFSFESDESSGRAGDDQAPSPLRYFLSGLGFCQQVWYAKGAALADLQLDELQIDVLTYMDMRGEHLIDGIDPNPQWIVIDAVLSSSGSDDQVRRAVDEANARCPVYNLIAKAVPVHTRVTHNGAVIRDDVPEGLGV